MFNFYKYIYYLLESFFSIFITLFSSHNVESFYHQKDRLETACSECFPFYIDSGIIHAFMYAFTAQSTITHIRLPLQYWNPLCAHSMHLYAVCICYNLQHRSEQIGFLRFTCLIERIDKKTRMRKCISFS